MPYPSLPQLRRQFWFPRITQAELGPIWAKISLPTDPCFSAGPQTDLLRCECGQGSPSWPLPFGCWVLNGRSPTLQGPAQWLGQFPHPWSFPIACDTEVHVTPQRKHIEGSQYGALKKDLG